MQLIIILKNIQRIINYMPLTIVLKNRFLLFLINYHNKKKRRKNEKSYFVMSFSIGFSQNLKNIYQIRKTKIKWNTCFKY